MNDDKIKKKLAPYRKKIDKIDDGIIRLLGRRYSIVRTIAAYKIDNDVHIIHNKRVREVRERNAKTAKAHGVSPDLVRALYTLIIDEAHVIELEMKARKKRR